MKLEKMTRQEILLQKLRAQWERPDLDEWEQYLQIFETPLKETQVFPGKFDRLSEKGAMFDKVPCPVSQEQAYAISLILEDLPDIQRMILRMTFWDGLTEEQIASVLRIPKRRVNYQKHAAIRNLRQKNSPKLPTK